MSRVEELWERLVRATLRRERTGIDVFGRPVGGGGIATYVPSSLANNRDIDAILRAADEIQDEDPNVSRILCEHAYSLTQNLDPNSEGRGVLQFKTGLISVIKQNLAKRDVGAIDRSQDIARLQEYYKLYREKNNVDQLREEEMKLRESGIFSGNLGDATSGGFATFASAGDGFSKAASQPSTVRASLSDDSNSKHLASGPPKMQLEHSKDSRTDSDTSTAALRAPPGPPAFNLNVEPPVSSVPKTEVSTALGSGSQSNLNSTSLAAGITMIIQPKQPPDAHSRAPLPSDNSTGGKNANLDVVDTEEDEMEETPETNRTNEISLDSFGGFGLGSTPSSNAPKSNPFGNVGTNQASSPFTMTVPSGELFRPASFNFQSPQPSQPSPAANLGAFSSGFGAGAASPAPAPSPFGQPAQIGAAGQNPVPSAFGQPAQIRARQQALGSVLGSFGQLRQFGTGLSGGFAGTSSMGGFSSATGGGFATFAFAGDGFSKAASQPSTVKASLSDDSNSKHLASGPPKMQQEHSKDSRTDSDTSTAALRAPPGPPAFNLNVEPPVSSVPKTEVSTALGSGSQSNLNSTSLAAGITMIIQPKQPPDAHSRAPLPSDNSTGGKNANLDVVDTEEDEMEETPETNRTNEISLDSFGGFGLGLTPSSNAPKSNPFGIVGTNQASSPFTMTVPSGELFRPASFNFQSPQPSQPSPAANLGAFSSGFGAGAASPACAPSPFGQPAQIGAASQVTAPSAFGQPAQIGAAGQNPAPSAFGQPAQIRARQQELGSVLGSFGQLRQFGTGLSGGFAGTSSMGGFSSATGGGFATFASAGDGFSKAASQPSTVKASLSDDSNSKHLASGPPKMQQEHSKDSRTDSDTSTEALRAPPGPPAFNLNVEPPVSSVPKTEVSTALGSGSQSNLNSTSLAAGITMIIQPKQPPDAHSRAPLPSGNSTGGKNANLDIVDTEEDEMEEETPETNRTNEISLDSFGGFGLGSTPSSNAPKSNPFSIVGTNQASSPFTMTVPSGELFRPASFNFQSPQPSQPSPAANLGAFSSGFGAGAAIPAPAPSPFGQPAQIGAASQVPAPSAFGQPAQIGAAGQNPAPSAFGQPTQIRARQQALGSVLGSFGQLRQFGTGLSGGFAGTSSMGGFSSATSGGFATFASAGDGFSKAASQPSTVRTSLSDDSNSKHFACTCVKNNLIPKF